MHLHKQTKRYENLDWNDKVMTVKIEVHITKM